MTTVDHSEADRRGWVTTLLVALALIVTCGAGGLAWLTAHGKGEPAGTVPVGVGPQSPAAGLPAVQLSPGTAPSAGAGGSSGGSVPPANGGGTQPTQPAGAAPSAGGQLGGATPTPASPKPASSSPFSDGTYRVGVDIVAGSWATGGVLNLSLNVCSFSVNHAPPTQLTVSIGLTTVHLVAGDSFTTSGCKPWRLTS